MPDDDLSEWRAEESPNYPADPDFIWTEPTADTLISGEVISGQIFPYPAQEFERCVSIIWEDTNPWDTLQISLDRDNSEVFGLGNDPTFTDTTVWAPSPFIQDPAYITVLNEELCWTPTCEQIRDEPYRFTFNMTTVACEEVQVETHFVDILVLTRSNGLLDIVPNVFTPNNDIMNDVWDIDHKDDFCIVNDNVKIYNRWGNPVYESEELLETWDGMYNGNPVANGEYYYVITYDFIFEEKQYTGGITIIDGPSDN
jgi:gliding motility-associated-like protein